MINFSKQQIHNTHLREITKERYLEVFNCLSPGRWVKNGGIESFFCIEPYDCGFNVQHYSFHDYFVSIDDRYFCKICDIFIVDHEQMGLEALEYIRNNTI